MNSLKKTRKAILASRRSLVIGLVALLFSFQSCECQPEPLELQGRLVESCDNPEPIAGVVMEYRSGSTQIYDTTGSDGRFRLVAESAPVLCPGCASLTAFTLDSLKRVRYQKEIGESYPQSRNYGDIRAVTERFVKLEITGDSSRLLIGASDTLYIAVQPVNGYWYGDSWPANPTPVLGPVSEGDIIDSVLISFPPYIGSELEQFYIEGAVGLRNYSFQNASFMADYQTKYDLDCSSPYLTIQLSYTE
ncbi:MAG: hypothetical protein HWE14_09645 [Flavobacteriia bacterium]|nr:hypothetical protein [Flavobacteriia bacterium]